MNQAIDAGGTLLDELRLQRGYLNVFQFNRCNLMILI